MKAYQHIVVEEGVVATVSLNRPDARNAMSDVTLREVSDAFGSLNREKNLRAVILRGRGDDFCSGGDLRWMRAGGRLSKRRGVADVRLLADALSKIAACPVPVIAAAQGNVFGGGLGLLAAADIVLLRDDARLCFSECRLGLVPAVVSCWVLPKIGDVHARRYYFTAELFDAATAVRIGLAAEALSESAWEEKIRAVARGVTQCGPRAVREAKSMISKMTALAPRRRVALAVDILARLRASAEGQEGLSAFLEKRPPSWTRA